LGCGFPLPLYLAHKRPGADKYQAVKFFYLADREHFRRYGRPITFDNYYALWYGPVASSALDLLNGASPALLGGSEKALPFKIEKGTVKTKGGKETETTFIREPLRPVNPEIFSKSDLQVFDQIISKYRNASFDDLYNETHKHFAYLNAWENRRHGGDRAEMFYDEMVDDEARRAQMPNWHRWIKSRLVKFAKSICGHCSISLQTRWRWKLCRPNGCVMP
jgi:hypothetical protein